jgi:hypothetical protein
MRDEVLLAIENAFHPRDVDPHLTENNGHVIGSVTVVGSDTFDQLDDIRRQRLLWQQLRGILGDRAL